MSIEPFQIHVPDDQLADLKTRLSLARYPVDLDHGPGNEWSYGAPTSVVKELAEYWQHKFDWRKVERELNEQLPQFVADIDTESEHGVLKIHFVHKRSKHPNAVPLIFVHGWPGSFAEVKKIIDPLTDPQDPKHPAFHVVAPSLPGYCFSESSRKPGCGLKTIAFIFNKLMKMLQYDQYIAQGGDWGALVVRGLAVWHPENIRAVHTNMFVTTSPSLVRHPLKLVKTILGFIGLPGGYSAEEIQGLKDIQYFREHELGYQQIQETKPHSLGYGFTDSPVALLAWLREKLHRWTDDYPWTHDEILTWVSLYWFSTAGPVGSIRIYRDAKGEPGPEVPAERDQRILAVSATAWNVPLGVSIFPKEVYRMPHDWGSMVQPLRFYRRHNTGGHFAAWEQPDLLLGDIRDFAAIVIPEDKRLQRSW